MALLARMYTSAAKKECLTACIIGKRLKNSLRRPEIFLAVWTTAFRRRKRNISKAKLRIKDFFVVEMVGLFGTEKSLTFQRSSCGKDFLSVLALLLSLFTALLLLTSQLTGFALYTSAAKKECLTALLFCGGDGGIIRHWKVFDFSAQ